ncbi:hypothetical protein HanHA89_Chr13g0495971 [Helianthus annuus]|nr:hypothetical protein HanHA89_Chr13g0495971 [Helianthus annuus]
MTFNWNGGIHSCEILKSNSLLEFASKYFNNERLAKWSSETTPCIKLLETSNTLSLVSFPIEFGMVPFNKFEDSENTLNEVSLPRNTGIGPVKRFEFKNISVKAVSLPNDFGIEPFN